MTPFLHLKVGDDSHVAAWVYSHCQICHGISHPEFQSQCGGDSLQNVVLLPPLAMLLDAVVDILQAAAL